MTRPHSQKRGPYKVTRMKCEWCGERFTSTEMRMHWGTCPKKPKGEKK